MDTSIEHSNGTKAASNNGKSTKKEVKQRRYLPSLPTASNADDMSKVDYSGLVDRTPVEFKSLKNYELFSLSPDGLFPMLKVSRNKVVRLFDREVTMTEGGRCHRIRLSSH